MRFKLNLSSSKILFYIIPFLFFSFFFILPNFVFADVPCDGPGESCGGACEPGYTNIGFCANSFGFLGTKLICCKEGAPPTTPTLRSEPETPTTPSTNSTPLPGAGGTMTPGTSGVQPATPPKETGGTLQDPNTGIGSEAGGTMTPGTSGIPTTPAAADTSKSLVPCTNNCTLCDIVVGIKRIFDYFMTLLVIVATLFIIIAGIAYMVSGGSKSLMEWAKKALMYALIGFVLYLASWLIVSSILSAMGYKRTSWSTFDCESGSEASK